MAPRKHGNAFDDAMELLIENGFDGMADVLRILLNEAMSNFIRQLWKKVVTASGH